MILQYYNDPTILIISAVVMVIALIFHNIAQAFVASRLGDSGPRFSGFLAFEPQRHLDPFGVLFLFLLGFGWPHAVPVNSRNYRGRGRQEAWVWLSGIGAYLLVGFISLAIAIFFASARQTHLYLAFQVAASYAILHAVINLFPVLPLDMAHAALAWGNPNVRRVIQQIAGFGVLGFMVFFFILSFLGVIGGLINIFLHLFQSIILGITGL
ncbi:MAG TPA: site-2 protease family protein [Trueperaceae bacterium]|nr:site-2 protease family protein [Trueperaceae bacterium]